MTYRNITPEILAKYSSVPTLNPDGSWSEWAHSTKPKQPDKKKRKMATPRTAPWIAAKAFKRGSGRLS